jgi:mannose-P-dolichol utilization defect protein 1
LQEVDDPIILYGFIAGFALNLVLAAQMIYYWNAPPSKVNVPQGKVFGKEGVPVVMKSNAKKSPAQKGPTTRRRG